MVYQLEEFVVGWKPRALYISQCQPDSIGLFYDYSNGMALFGAKYGKMGWLPDQNHT